MKLTIIGMVIGLLGALISFLTFSKQEPAKAFYFSIIFLVIGTSFLLFDVYLKHKEIVEIEEKFPEFLSALAEAMRSGMTLIKAFEHVSKMNLGKLTKYIEKMYYKMTWGIPFPKILEDFSKEIPSKEVRRAAIILLESYLVGGEIIETLDSLSESLKRLREIRKDIKVVLGEQVKVIYAVNILFMIILSVIYFVVIPIQFGSVGEAFGFSLEIDVQKYKEIFVIYAISIAISSGLIVGVVSEGRLSGAVKHIIILLAINLTIIGVVFLRKVVTINIEVPEKFELGKTYEVKGNIIVEGKGCNGELKIYPLGITSKIIDGEFKAELKFEEPGEHKLVFLFYCDSEVFKKEVKVNVR